MQKYPRCQNTGPRSKTHLSVFRGAPLRSNPSTIPNRHSNPRTLVHGPYYCGTAGCTKTRHLFYGCDLLTYWYCGECAWIRCLGKASNPSSWHHYFQYDTKFATPRTLWQKNRTRSLGASANETSSERRDKSQPHKLRLSGQSKRIDTVRPFIN